MDFQLSNLIGIGLKVSGIIFSMFYILFALVIIKQVQTMRNVIQLNDKGFLLLVSYVQLLLGLVLLVYCLIVL